MHRKSLERSSLRLTSSSLASAVALVLGAPSVIAADSSSKTPVAATKPDIEITVSETAPQGTDQVGKNSFDKQDLKRQLNSSADLNQITRTVAGVQFDNANGSITEDDVLNLRPSRLSISGGRPYENSFVVDGLSTTSMLDSSNDNMHNYIEVVGHPQTTFVNPSLVDSVEIYTNDVPAEFGGFTGGVVSAKLRDPKLRFGFEASYSQTSDGWTRYLVDSAHATATSPEKARFERNNSGYTVDLPLSPTSSFLVDYARTESLLENTQRLALYGINSSRAQTVSENVTFKYLNKLSAANALRFTSIYSPYNQENYEQSAKFQYNDGWVNNLEFTHKVADILVEAKIGYSWTSTDRKQDPDMYTYKNMGSVNWVSASNSTAAKGGFGDLISRQNELPLNLKAEKGLWEGAKLAAGLQYSYITARKARPITNSAYRHQTVSTVKLDPRITSADGPGDLTVIEGEQALNYRIVYYAFDTHVSIKSLGAWSQLSDHGKILGIPWNYRAGIRYDRNDYLKNDDVAPRLTAQVSPFSWLSFNAGYNRYYSNTLLSYKLREGYPDSYIYTRTGKLNSAGKLVFSKADWTLYSHTKTTSYGGLGLSTPYSDEISLGTAFDLSLLGKLNVSYVKRISRGSITRNTGTRIPYTTESGSTAYYTLYSPSNSGYTDYHAVSLAWSKKWRNHSFKINTTFSETKTSTNSSDSDPDYWDSYDDTDMNEEVYYKGQVRIRRDLALERSNYAVPNYVNAIWSSDWFKNRLKLDLIGRWNESYTRMETNTTITVNGAKYDLYEDVNVPANLIADVNVAWTAWQSERAGAVELTLKVGNVLNKLPHTENASTTNPYQLGRSFWAGVRYTF